MKIDKQSNLYTVVYIMAIVVVVGAALAYTSVSLHDRQQENMDVDKMRQILASLHVVPEKKNIHSEFDRYIAKSFIVGADGKNIQGDAFAVDVSAESKLPSSSRRLPVYVATMPDGARKYVLPVYGSGLWGPIWGYVSLDDDCSTIFGAYFAHQSETPGLGAEIANSVFSKQFVGKQMFKAQRFLPVNVLKKGKKPQRGEDYVDGISGGTITSKGVGAMLDNCLSPYETFLNSVRSESK